ncbi:MAG: ABC transporter permease [Spirochaetes bacterium]|nr:ABC transporter permease [Spirochaetota bacterium]MBU1080664.1 ABC transporter permease [Spirochaetota bacterium]
MNTLAHHVLYEFKAGLRDKSQLLMNYLFPLLFFTLVGAIMTRLDPSFKDRVIPAMAIFSVMCSYLLSMPAGLVTARESGVLRSYRISGVPSWSTLAAPVVASIGHMALVTLIVAGVSVAALGSAVPASVALFVLVWLAMTAAYAGLGALIAVVSPSSRAVNLIAQVVYIPSIMLGGLMMPSGVLPPALEAVASLLPAKHAMNAFAGGEGAAISLAALVAGAIVSFALASWLFEWDGTNSRAWPLRLLALLALAPYAVAMFF